MASPKITLYTNHRCPFAHRVHIVLAELGLPYDEVIIDLDKPREPWYLDINPRGLVPSIKYTGGGLHEEIVTESAIVAQFLLESHGSGSGSALLPTAELPDPRAALRRARVNFFLDTWNGKVQPLMYKLLKEEDVGQKEVIAREWVGVVEKEIEPLLKDAAPFFGGSQGLTFAEVIVAPFLLRHYAFAEYDVYPPSWKDGLDALPHFSKWAQATISHPSVTKIWDKEAVVKKTLQRLGIKAPNV